MRNLVLVKYTIEKLHTLHNVINVINSLKDKYNLALLIIQRDLGAPIRGVPIFNQQEILEFQDAALALDVLAAKEIEKADIKDAFLFDIDPKLGITTLPKVSSIKEFCDKVN